jgi:arylsulfatase A-like enzyme
MRVALASALAVLALAPAAQARPNILVLETDDQTLADMSALPKTRALIGGRGTTFSNSFVNYALCCPSRSTLYTGQYAHNHGVLSNKPPFGGFTRLDTSNWLPLWLQAAGYRTMHVGKFLNGYGRDAPPTVPPGFDDWYGMVDPSTYAYYGYTVDENGVLRTHPGVYSTDFVTAKANELIAAAARGSRPFFMSVAWLAPHTGAPREVDDLPGIPSPSPAPKYANAFAMAPLPRPASFNELDVNDKPLGIQARPRLGPVRVAKIQEAYQQRLESLLSVDDGVAAIVARLRSLGELDDTLILFTSDNGYFHGEHRVPNGKVLPYEPSIRVPLLMRGPGVPQGRTAKQLVTNADLAPTILDAADATARRVQDGRSLFGLLGDRGLEWGRELLLEGGGGVQAGVQGFAFTGLRNYRWKYVEYATGERELYDLERDPDELTSLQAAPRYAPLRRALAKRLHALQTCAGRSCRAKPALRLAVSRRCGKRPTLRGADVRSVETVKLRVRRTRHPRVRATVRLKDGRAVTLEKRLPRCRR